MAKRKKPQIKRPYATYYYTLATDKEAATVSRGACSSEEGAIRATVVRVFMGQYAKAIIFDRYAGVPIYHVRTGPGGIQVRFGSGIEHKDWRTAAWAAQA